MRRSLKLFLVTLAVLAGWGGVYGLSFSILQWNGLAFTNLSNGIFAGVAIVLALLLVAEAIWLLFQTARKKLQKVWVRVVSVLGIFVLIAATCYFSFVGVFLFAFSYSPEHVVEKEGEVMLARVDSFLQVMVYYSDYKNPFVCGTTLRGWEDYGNGGYDPFERDEMPKPHRGTFYNKNGEIIKQFGPQ